MYDIHDIDDKNRNDLSHIEPMTLVAMNFFSCNRNFCIRSSKTWWPVAPTGMRFALVMANLAFFSVTDKFFGVLLELSPAPAPAPALVSEVCVFAYDALRLFRDGVLATTIGLPLSLSDSLSVLLPRCLIFLLDFALVVGVP